MGNKASPSSSSSLPEEKPWGLHDANSLPRDLGILQVFKFWQQSDKERNDHGTEIHHPLSECARLAGIYHRRPF